MVEQELTRSSLSFSHGIHPEEAKDITKGKAIRRLSFAPHYIVLMSQHAGKPAKPIVRKGEEVIRGQKIAEADGFFSVPMHAPVSGYVEKVGRALDVDGKMVSAMTVVPFFGSAQEQPANFLRPIDQLSSDEIVAAIKEMGMVGLGGAAFPTHVKFTPPKDKSIEIVLLNGCECEPYLTSDHRVMLEQPEAILVGTKLILKALHAKRAILAVEENKPDALAVLRSVIPASESISVQTLVTKYPQGAEKMLTRALLKKDIPSGGLPADIGVMISNVATVAEIGTLLPRGQGLVERVVTVSGKGVERPGNYLVPIGTPLNFLLEQVGLLETARQVIFGGPMMGKSVAFLDTPITKGVSGILVLDKTEILPKRAIHPCIRCGECLHSCPIHLNPSRLGLLAKNAKYERMADEYNLFDCFECGCCSFVCPSNIPLVQLFRQVKGIIRERRAKG